MDDLEVIETDDSETPTYRNWDQVAAAERRRREAEARQRVLHHVCDRTEGTYCSDCLRGKKNPYPKKKTPHVKCESPDHVLTPEERKAFDREERLDKTVRYWVFHWTWNALTSEPHCWRFLRALTASVQPISDEQKRVWSKAIRRIRHEVSSIPINVANMRKRMEAVAEIIQQEVGVGMRLRAWEQDAINEGNEE